MSDHADSASSAKPDDAEPKHDTKMIEAPPTTIWGILFKLGPGLILCGSIVGSGELIATPETAARAGFSLLWLIALGTVIKVFVQVEFGRFAIVNGLPSLWGMNDVPGPTMEVGSKSSETTYRGNWLAWYWLLMFLMSLAQLGGIVGGVGQALAISIPITSAGRAYNDAVDKRTELNLEIHESAFFKEHPEPDRKVFSAVELTEREERLIMLGWMIKGLPADKRAAWDPAKNASLGKEFFTEKNAEEILALHATLDAERKAQKEALATAAPADAAKLKETHDKRIAELKSQIAALEERKALLMWLDANNDSQISADEFQAIPAPLEVGLIDDKIWAALVTVVTAIILVMGNYGFIEAASIALVASFTFMTIANLIMLQVNGSWAITLDDLAKGFSFQLPADQGGGTSALTAAFTTFGIIGVGANELIQYPSWCIEKGYARYSGPRDDSPEWAERAKGWLNVMCWDAWLSLIVYTFATIAFYLIGAAVLGRLHLIPQGNDMIRTLSAMYEPVFGDWTQVLFFYGAFAVLYSTFFAATAGHARVCADAITIFTRSEHDEARSAFWTRVFSAILPFVCLSIYVFYPSPTLLVKIGAGMQAIMLPMLAGAALYFRYYRNDDRVAPGPAWDIFLWISCAGMSAAGCAALFFALREIGGMFK